MSFFSYSNNIIFNVIINLNYTLNFTKYTANANLYLHDSDQLESLSATLVTVHN